MNARNKSRIEYNAQFYHLIATAFSCYLVRSN